MEKPVLKPIEFTYHCPVCNKMTSDRNGAGVCGACENKRYWIDPAGGRHHNDPDSDEFEDPAKMYE
jgi:ribosomal protein L37AE/L43A